MFIYLLVAFPGFADSGYRLWLRYEPVNNISILNTYIRMVLLGINFPGLSTAKDELAMGLEGLLGKKFYPLLSLQRAVLL